MLYYILVKGGVMMNLTLAAKIKINPTNEQAIILKETMNTYRKACNFVSEIIFHSKILTQAKLHNMT